MDSSDALRRHIQQQQQRQQQQHHHHHHLHHHHHPGADVEDEVPLDPNMLYAAASSEHVDAISSLVRDDDFSALDSHEGSISGGSGGGGSGVESTNISVVDSDPVIHESRRGHDDGGNGLPGVHLDGNDNDVAGIMVDPAIGHDHGADTIMRSTEQVTVFHCPVQSCLNKTRAKRGRRAMLRHLRSRMNDDREHAEALSAFLRRATPMTKQERSRKTSATYREKHQTLAEEQAKDAGEPYMAPLYNPVLVKKHEAYVRKKIKTALDAADRPTWPVAPGTSAADNASSSLLRRHLGTMQANVLWLLQELGNKVYFPPGTDIPSKLHTQEEMFRRGVREMEQQFPDRADQIRYAAGQLDDKQQFEHACMAFQIWKKQDDLSRARRQLDKERYERECEEAARRMEEYDYERTDEGINRKVADEMAKWTERMRDKLREQWHAGAEADKQLQEAARLAHMQQQEHGS
ncbi:hypothetical protein V1514DRAFT_322336 [Lipomyces japonicus]|uniref:uncharacterized protein n=1 Tax=Lipomyces japonicus TaxID=56871 RepID=UPI0034CE1EA0